MFWNVYCSSIVSIAFLLCLLLVYVLCILHVFCVHCSSIVYIAFLLCLLFDYCFYCISSVSIARLLCILHVFCAHCSSMVSIAFLLCLRTYGRFRVQTESAQFLILGVFHFRCCVFHTSPVPSGGNAESDLTEDFVCRLRVRNSSYQTCFIFDVVCLTVPLCFRLEMPNPILRTDVDTEEMQ